MTDLVSVRAVAKILRTAGFSVVTGTPKWSDSSNAWIIGDHGKALVINCQTHSILGFGCITHPEYEETRKSLTNKILESLRAAGVDAKLGANLDQIFLNGYSI